MKPFQIGVLDESISHQTVFGKLVRSYYLQKLHFIKHVEIGIVVFYGDGIHYLHGERSVKNLLLFCQNEVKHLFNEFLRELVEMRETNLSADL